LLLPLRPSEYGGECLFVSDSRPRQKHWCPDHWAHRRASNCSKEDVPEVSAAPGRCQDFSFSGFQIFTPTTGAGEGRPCHIPGPSIRRSSSLHGRFGLTRNWRHPPRSSRSDEHMGQIPDARISLYLQKAHDRPVNQRPENLLLYLNKEGEKKRGQASKVARAIRATLIHPSDASASTVLAGEVRKA
jgi:hypothetical protein